VTRAPLGSQAGLEWTGSVWKRRTVRDSSVTTSTNVMTAGMEAVPKIPSAIMLRYALLSPSQVRNMQCFFQPAYIPADG
jgi:hypothetical protein